MGKNRFCYLSFMWLLSITASLLEQLFYCLSRREIHVEPQFCIFGFLKNNLLNGWSVTADLPGLQYQLPAVLDTSLRPDIAVWCNSSRMLKIFELTVFFENNFSSSSNLKRKKYQSLVRMANTKGWKAEIHPLQTGSRGLVDNQSFQPVSDIMTPLLKTSDSSGDNCLDYSADNIFCNLVQA